MDSKIELYYGEFYHSGCSGKKIPFVKLGPAQPKTGQYYMPIEGVGQGTVFLADHDIWTLQFIMLQTTKLEAVTQALVRHLSESNRVTRSLLSELGTAQKEFKENGH